MWKVRTTQGVVMLRPGNAGRKARPVPGSLLSLHGFVRHMADVERIWLTPPHGSIGYAFGLRVGKGLDPRPAVPKAIGRYLDIELTVAARAL
jgi:hypothetical protein